MTWRIFYDDGSEVADNLDEVKSFGVICIVQDQHGSRKHILAKKDYYLFNGEHWIVLDMVGVIDHLVHKPETIKKLIVGRTVDSHLFWTIYDKAKQYV